MGAARNKETLEWAQNDVFGKAKQTSKSVTINEQRVSTSIQEKMDYLVPAAKIADMATGWLAGQAARDFTPTDKASLDVFNNLPKMYNFASDKEKEIMLNRNFKRINDEVDAMISELLGITPQTP